VRFCEPSKEVICPDEFTPVTIPACVPKSTMSPTWTVEAKENKLGIEDVVMLRLAC
jgi:hypothetical protein